MSDPLSIIAGTIAIFDFTDKGIRFARDVKNAGRERKEFEDKLKSLEQIQTSIKKCLDPGLEVNPGWKAELSVGSSPLMRLRDTVEDMLKTLEKAGSKKHSLRDILWHSEKKAFGEYFQNIDSYCSQVNMILTSAGLHETKQVHVEVVEIRKDMEREKIEAWIPAIDFQARHQDFLDKANTSGKEFLGSLVFKCWSGGHLRKLRCFGDRGAGKVCFLSFKRHIIFLTRSS